MYAIVESGGKQYKAVPGASIEVDRLQVEEGAQVDLDQVLLVSDGEEVKVGTPTVDGVTVKTTVVEHFKGRKILVLKYKARERYRHRQGHRQQYTRLQVDEISVK
jgi:large subunit ribosomal protein L21